MLGEFSNTIHCSHIPRCFAVSIYTSFIHMLVRNRARTHYIPLKAIVASFPIRDRMILLPPGCWSIKEVTLWTIPSITMSFSAGYLDCLSVSSSHVIIGSFDSSIHLGYESTKHSNIPGPKSNSFFIASIFLCFIWILAFLISTSWP